MGYCQTTQHTSFRSSLRCGKSPSTQDSHSHRVPSVLSTLLVCPSHREVEMLLNPGGTSQSCVGAQTLSILAVRLRRFLSAGCWVHNTSWCSCYDGQNVTCPLSASCRAPLLGGWGEKNIPAFSL